MSENGEINTAGKKFYTPAGTDGMDKFHLCSTPPLFNLHTTYIPFSDFDPCDYKASIHENAFYPAMSRLARSI